MNKSLEEFGNISDKYIEEADSLPHSKKNNIKYILGAVACVVLLAGSVFGVMKLIENPVIPNVKVPITNQPENRDFSKNLIASPVLRKFPTYPQEKDFAKLNGEVDYDAYDEKFKEWREAQISIKNTPENYMDSLVGFTQSLTKELLLGDFDENRVFSPVNLYLALSMAAETAGGNSRKQLLEVLQADSIEALRSYAANLFTKTYLSDGIYTCLPSNSLWLNEKVQFDKICLENLAEVYKAYSFAGDPASKAYNKSMKDWLNFATGNLLTDSVKDIEMDSESIMTLISSLFLSGKWVDEFRKTENRTFHGTMGDQTAEFLIKDTMQAYCFGNSFAAVNTDIESGGEMIIVLPDEGKTVSDLLGDSEFISFFSAPYKWEQHKITQVHFKAPKFDVKSDLDLKQGLQNMGVTDIFDAQASDFSNLAPGSQGIFVNKVQHSVRVQTDEKGISAAAYTVMDYAGSSMPEDEVDFIVDRPFIFIVTGLDGSPLFVGTVNNIN